MASDVVGYSALMGRDEAGTLSAIRSLRKELWGPKIDEYGGRVVKTTGDGQLTEFASVADAVQCAAEVQRAMRRRNADIPEDHRIALRVGINQGDVIVDGDDIYGDGVNVAARLEEAAEPGGICISRAVRDQIRDKLLYELEDLGEQDLKNIARPVRVFRVSIEETGDTVGAKASAPPARSPAASAPTPKSGAARPWMWPALGGAAIALIAIVLAAVYFVPDEGSVTVGPVAETQEPEDPILALPTGPRIAVLPFDNLGGDPDQEYFSDGLTEDLITELSRFKDLRVLARNTTFQYKGQSVDVQEGGRALDVEFVLEGSVRRSGDQIRISAQLIDAADGAHVWAERYDRGVADIFAVQDEITGQIVAALASAQQGALVAAADSRRAAEKAPDDLQAYELVLRFKALGNQKWSKEGYPAAKALLERAIAIDPNYARAHAELARWAVIGWMFGFDESALPPDVIKESAIRAVTLDPDDAGANHAAAWGFFFDKQMDRFEAVSERALTLAPNDALLLAEVGALLGFAGEWERSVALVTKADTLNPEAAAGWYHSILYYDHFFEGQYAEALSIISQSPAQNLFETVAKYGIASAKLGRQADAEIWAAKLNEFGRGRTVSELRDFWRIWNFREGDIDLLLDGARKAGIPEDAAEAIPQGPRIAVLPFANLSGDPEQEYFSDGMTEEIITELARFRDLFVMARQSTAQYKGQDASVAKIAEDLGVDYVVEGSVRRGGDTVRITAQLIDTATGAHLWAETYDRDLTTENLFAIQDDIAAQVVASIGGVQGAITQARLGDTRRNLPTRLDAYECVLLSSEARLLYTAEVHLQARDCLESAVEIDPTYAEAWSALSLMYGWEVAGVQPSAGRI